MINGKKFFRIGIFSLFAGLFCIGNFSNAKLYNVDTIYQYNYDILNGDFEITSDLNFPYEKPIQFAGSRCNATTIFWYDRKLGFITQRSFNTSNCNQEAGEVVQGFFTKICKVSYLNNNDQALILGRNFNCPSNSRVDIEEFYNTTGTLTSIAFMQEYYANYPRNFCFNFQDINTSYCVLTNLRKGDARPNQYSGFDFTTVTNYESLINYVSPLPYSPFTVLDNSSPTIIYTDSDVDMVINYYEQRGYRESMCYVGTDNLTAEFGTSGISFDDGSGDSIFGLYNSIYSGFGNNIIQNVGKFINVRDINYGQWYYCDGENCPRWLAELTGNDVNINLNYTGLTFPFVNKPVAIYFMASNLYETYNIDTHGMDVAFYCYSKLNRDSIADGSIDYSDIREKAGSGVLDKIDTYNQYLIDYYTPKGTFQIPTSGEFWNSFGSGEDYSGVNNIDMSETFSNFFTKFTNVFQNWSPAYSTGIIPDWIIFPLIFLLLFRVMKH